METNQEIKELQELRQDIHLERINLRKLIVVARNLGRDLKECIRDKNFKDFSIGDYQIDMFDKKAKNNILLFEELKSFDELGFR